MSKHIFTSTCLLVFFNTHITVFGDYMLESDTIIFRAFANVDTLICPTVFVPNDGLIEPDETFSIMIGTVDDNVLIENDILEITIVDTGLCLY